jgi:hypothetical protein
MMPARQNWVFPKAPFAAMPQLTGKETACLLVLDCQLILIDVQSYNILQIWTLDIWLNERLC